MDDKELDEKIRAMSFSSGKNTMTLEIGVVQDGVWLDDPFVLRFLPADPRGAGCAAGTNAGGV